MKIVKVLLDDGTSREIKEIKNLSFFQKKYPENNKLYHQRAYERQFSDFEDEIIELLNESNIKEYAKDHLNLVLEDDVEEKDISDFTDYEILEEMKARRLNKGNDIISSDFINRFENIMKAENSLLLDNILTELEKNLNI